jgi:rubrerythrin
MHHHRGFSSPDEILSSALEKEQEAHDFYEGLAKDCTIDFVKEVLLKLQNEESKHMRVIQDMIARLESGRHIT